ncbi:putative polysaccharide biosynthesis protein [Sellimonas caecigallum]|uniref:Polysaccharide biosynthesis protein n=1 Tax=Sellimonas caecigallum TaxID=2592333 RepID=A0ABS7L933_9FIRM|nr:polysaccharide biosynthesis protein [Sellimonas caecigallum]MBY0759586.1 polysaccharide biosynthesis protein [Sellimonas caecigallum]
MGKKKNGNEFLVQGSILAAAGMISRIIGMIYRIPLLNIMGITGQGFYEVAYQIYNIALILTSYSLPLAVSKLVSARLSKGQEKNAYRILKTALLFAAVVGGGVSFLIFFGADFIAGDIMKMGMSAYGLRVLAPGLFIVAVMGVLRGYFQGRGSMVPTAVSQILEQIIHAIVSIVGAAVLLKYGQNIAEKQGNKLYGPAYSAAGATLGVIVGGLTALMFLILIFYAYKNVLRKKMYRDKHAEKESFRFLFRILILTIAPVILSSTVYNIQNVIDSAMFTSIMSAQGFSEKYAADLLGSLGQYYTLFNVPLFMANALGSSVVPPLVRAYENKDSGQVHQKIELAMRMTMLIAVPSAVAFIVIPKEMLDLIWGSIDNTVAANLFRIGAVSIVFYSISTLTNAVLQGINKMMAPVKNATVSLIIHVVCLFIMLVVFHWSIYAVVASKVVFGITMCILNAHDLREAVGYIQEKKKTFILPTIAAVIMGVVVFVVQFMLALVIHDKVATVIAIVVGVVVYGVGLLAIGGLTEQEIRSMPKGIQIAGLLKKVHLLK